MKVSILIGTIIGAGVLSLPYVYSKLGPILAILLTFLFSLFFILIAIIYSKIALMYGKHQFPGYVELFFGKKIKYTVLLLLLITLYGTVLSYYIAQANAIYNLTGIPKYLAILLSFLLLNLALIKNIKSVEDFEKANVLIVISFLITISFYFLTFYNININKLFEIHPEHVVYFIGPIIFSLFGLNAIPELRELISDEKEFRNTIIIGYLIPTILYILFSLSIVLTHNDIPSIATFLLGPLGYILTYIITFNPMVSLSYAIKEIYLFDLKLDNELSHVLTVLPPFLISFIINDPKQFVGVLSIVGWLSFLISIPLIVVMYLRMRTKR